MPAHPGSDELQIARLGIDLGALEAGGPVSGLEARLAKAAAKLLPTPRAALREARRSISQGGDPLGEELCDVRPQVQRRKLGAFYTHQTVVDAMVRWVREQQPVEVIDCGSGSGRFAIAAAAAIRQSSVVAVEIDPLSSLITRANVAVRRLNNVVVVNQDFTTLKLPSIAGRRAFVGNPPYVRHHSLTADQKLQGRKLSASLGVKWSRLSGLHMQFILTAAALSEVGDVMCFITSAEWLDVNYGEGVRQLVTDGLRAEEIHLLASDSFAFAEAATTAVIVCARRGGDAERVLVRTPSSAAALSTMASAGHYVSRSELQFSKSWRRVLRERSYRETSERDQIPLGSVVRVHRGTVTGSNQFFLMTKERARSLHLENSVRPIITSADEVLASGGVVRETPHTKALLSPPPAERLSAAERHALEAYIGIGRARHIDDTYVAAHRTPWWRPQVKPPPPIVATYMARQAPAFARNPDGLLIVNVIHGLYPIAPLTDEQLDELADTLNAMREGYRGRGRVYQGGLEKFEPHEMERLLIKVPSPARLAMLCDA